MWNSGLESLKVGFLHIGMCPIAPTAIKGSYVPTYFDNRNQGAVKNFRLQANLSTNFI